MSAPNEDLLRKAQKLKEQSDAAKKALSRKHKNSSAEKARRHIGDLRQLYAAITEAVGWIYQNIIAPFVRHPWVGGPFRAYGNLWRAYTYVEDRDGDEIFSKRRGGTMLLATLVFLWILPSFLAVTAEFVIDTSRMTMSWKEREVWYLGKSEEIDPEGNIFSAQGCESIQCSDQTSIYFRIKPSLAHHLWSLYNNGNIFFPDFVAAGIQNDVNKCTVTGYGARWKFLVRNWDVYPQILSIDCVPLTETEIIKGVDSPKDEAPVAEDPQSGG